MSTVAIRESALPALQMNEGELIKVLQTSLYPGAALESIKMVLGYCKASGLDPMQKPVHIVPMWDSKAGGMRDVIMPGVGLYRTQAARSGCAGVTEPDFGQDVTEKLGGQEITYPNWCRVTVKRKLASGEIVEFTAKEFWKENYAVRGGKEKSIAPNAMWTKRPYGQIAKCAEAQALRKAFPELGSEPTAEEMTGKAINEHSEAAHREPVYIDPALLQASQDAAALGVAAYRKYWTGLTNDQRAALFTAHNENKAMAEQVDKARTVETPAPAQPPAATPGAPIVSYDSIMQDMLMAEDEERLQEAADLIGAITSPEQRAQLSAVYQDRMSAFTE